MSRPKCPGLVLYDDGIQIRSPGRVKDKRLMTTDMEGIPTMPNTGKLPCPVFKGRRSMTDEGGTDKREFP